MVAVERSKNQIYALFSDFALRISVSFAVLKSEINTKAFVYFLS